MQMHPSVNVITKTEPKSDRTGTISTIFGLKTTLATYTARVARKLIAPATSSTTGASGFLFALAHIAAAWNATALIDQFTIMIAPQYRIRWPSGMS